MTIWNNSKACSTLPSIIPRAGVGGGMSPRCHLIENVHISCLLSIPNSPTPLPVFPGISSQINCLDQILVSGSALRETITKTPAQQPALCLDLHFKCVRDRQVHSYTCHTIRLISQLSRLRRQEVIGRVIATQRRGRCSRFGAVPLAPRTLNKGTAADDIICTAWKFRCDTARVSSGSHHHSRRTSPNNLHTLLLKQTLQTLGSPGS